MVETQTGNKVKRVQSDNETEEIKKAINELCSSRGILHELSCPYTAQQNGRAERENRILTEAVTALLIDSGLPKYMWAEALNYAVFTLNRTGKSPVAGKSPYEVFYNKEKFDIRLLKPFGAKVVCQVPKSA